MNINNVSNVNFKAHFKDNFEYYQLRNHVINEHNIPAHVFKEIEEDMRTLPAAEVTLDYFDTDETRSFLHGTIQTKDGNILDLDLVQPHCENLIFDVYNTVAHLLKK